MCLFWKDDLLSHITYDTDFRNLQLSKFKLTNWVPYLRSQITQWIANCQNMRHEGFCQNFRSQ